MNFEVDRSSWAHIALCADLTWATEPPDEFIIANQRLWAQHCRVSQILQESTLDSQQGQCDLTENKCTTPSQSQENGNSSGRRSVKDVIPESRLAQFYGNFYYDEIREKCYTSANERINFRGCNGQGCENNDLTECWMLPEVEYWFRKLLDDPSERSLFPRRRRQYRMLPDDDFERWSVSGARGEEATLAARVDSVRGLWNAAPAQPRAPSPPPAPRKMRARRRQPRRLTALAPPPPAYCLELPAQLFCDPACKFQLQQPRAPQVAECARAIGRITASVQAALRNAAPYRGTNVGRYAPTAARPGRAHDRRCVWWPRDHPSPRLDRPRLARPVAEPEQERPPDDAPHERGSDEAARMTPDRPDSPTEKEARPSTSADAGLRTRRLYSAVLSASAPGLPGCVRLAQKPVALKLNPRIVLPGARLRRPTVDREFEELEKQALEQYKASDESIDTKFRELERLAEEQYSGTSCGGACAEKPSTSPAEAAGSGRPPKFRKEKPVGSVVIYSQNFPDLSAKRTSSVINLKNFRGPPRGDKKEGPGGRARPRAEAQRAASDSDYEAREAARSHKGPSRWAPPKKRHLAACASDGSSDEERAARIEDAPRRLRLARHGAGDLRPLAAKRSP